MWFLRLLSVKATYFVANLIIFFDLTKTKTQKIAIVFRKNSFVYYSCNFFLPIINLQVSNKNKGQTCQMH